MSPRKIRQEKQHYTPEYRDEAVNLVESQPHRPIGEIAAELGLKEKTLAHWCRRRRKSGSASTPPLNETERAELERLRKENVRLQMEREILKKATAFFARESE